MIISNNFYTCAATYLNKVPSVNEINPPKKERKVEATSAVSTGKRFNQNAETKANFASYLDICE